MVCTHGTFKIDSLWRQLCLIVKLPRGRFLGCGAQISPGLHGARSDVTWFIRLYPLAAQLPLPGPTGPEKIHEHQGKFNVNPVKMLSCASAPGSAYTSS